MLLSLLSMAFLVLSIIFYISANPLSMGILVLLLALCVTFITSLIISSWLCFLIFLIYIGGMLVLFSYFVAITPNIPMPSLLMFLVMLSISPCLALMIMMYPSSSPAGNQPELFIPIFYTSPNFPMLLTLAMVLFMTMVVVVKLVAVKGGPFRPFNHYV